MLTHHTAVISRTDNVGLDAPLIVINAGDGEGTYFQVGESPYGAV